MSHQENPIMNILVTDMTLHQDHICQNRKASTGLAIQKRV